MTASISTGPPKFATIYDVTPIPSPTGFVVTARTDQPIQLQLDWWSVNDPSITTAATAPVEAGPTTQHVFTVTMPAGNHAGYTFGFSFRQDSNDPSGLTWRPVQGTVRLTGSRTSRNLAVPVRFYQFGGAPPAPVGGGGIGSWNQYTWAQYNPKGT